MSVDATIAKRKLQALTLALKDWRPFWPLAMRIIRIGLRQQFESEGRFLGQPWAPLSAGYLAAKAAKYPGKSILVASGRLKRAATAPEWRGMPTALHIVIRNDVAGYHQHGTGKMPARPIIPDRVAPELGLMLTKAATDYLQAAIRRHT